MSKITIKEIAKMAGVANSTVTNALNPNSRKISTQKRAEILKIVDEVGYIPSKSAQSLSTKNRKCIGFFLRASSDFTRGIIDQQLIYFLNKYAHESSIELITIITSYDQEKSFAEIERQIMTYNLTHVVIQGLDNDLDILSKIINLNTIKILIELPATNNNTTFISTDNYRAQYDLTTEIIQKYNPQNVLYVSGNKEAYVSLERLGGFTEAIQKFNVNYDVIHGNFNKDIMREIISGYPVNEYNYIACASDIIASVIAKECSKLNHHNLIISGFDGDDFLEFLDFKMYTVKQDVELLCKSIINMILTNSFESKLLPYKIVSYN